MGCDEYVPLKLNLSVLWKNKQNGQNGGRNSEDPLFKCKLQILERLSAGFQLEGKERTYMVLKIVQIYANYL